MPSPTAKDRVSLCLFTYEDSRRCRTPRISSHPHFCFYHAQKESQSQSTEKLAKDLTYFFSGDYLSANDLNTALSRLIPAVVRGEIKPRVARTVAYMLQTLMQSNRQAQHEYINAFSTDGWRDAISTSVTSNHDYLYPPDPNDSDPEHESDDELEDVSAAAPEPQQPAPTVGAGLVYTACPEERRESRSARPAPTAPPDHTSPPPASPQQTSAAPPTRPSPADTEAALAAARAIFPDRSNSAPPQSASATPNPASPTPQPTSIPTPTNPTPPPATVPGPSPLPRRRHHNTSTNSFATNIYTRPAGF